MKFIIVGNMFQGTTSLEVFMRKKGKLVARMETLTNDENGINEFNKRFSGCTPVIIWSKIKPEVDIFDWLVYKPLIYNLEEIAKDPDFPHLNIGSSNHKYFDQNKHFMASVMDV